MDQEDGKKAGPYSTHVLEEPVLLASPRELVHLDQPAVVRVESDISDDSRLRVTVELEATHEERWRRIELEDLTGQEFVQLLDRLSKHHLPTFVRLKRQIDVGSESIEKGEWILGITLDRGRTRLILVGRRQHLRCELRAR